MPTCSDPRQRSNFEGPFLGRVDKKNPSSAVVNRSQLTPLLDSSWISEIRSLLVMKKPSRSSFLEVVGAEKDGDAAQETAQ